MSHVCQCEITETTTLLDIEYVLRVEFGFAEAEPAMHFDPAIPAHPYDERIVGGVVWVGRKRIAVDDERDLKELNQMLDPSAWPEGPQRDASKKFLDAVHDAIAEHMKNEREAAQEAFAEAKFQAMRDGE